MSSRGLIRSMVVVGGAQAVNILVSILRMKVIALFLGPTGIGLLGIYNNLKEMISMSAGLGLGSSAVREIASAREDEATLSRVRRVLFAALLIQGLLAMGLVWGMRRQISDWMFGAPDFAGQVGVIGVAVLFTLLAASQTALLQGMRQISHLAWTTVLSALIGTVVGLSAVAIAGEDGLIWFVLVQPVAAVIVAYFFTRRLPAPTTDQMSPAQIWEVWRPMVKLGGVCLVGALATTLTLLIVRGLITRDLGLSAAGQFAAAWTVTMTYVGFMLNAMTADYFPRLTEVAKDSDAASGLMNDQTQIAVALAGPLLLLMIGGAPWLIHLLYSAEFGEAGRLLQWQMVGNLFKLVSWSIGMSVVAAGRSGLFLALQMHFNVVFLGLLWLGLPALGLEVAGIAFLCAYVLHAFWSLLIVRRQINFRLQPLSLWLITAHAGLAFALLGVALVAPVTAAVSGLVLFAVTSVIGIRIALRKMGPDGRWVSRAHKAFDKIGWPIGDAT